MLPALLLPAGPTLRRTGHSHTEPVLIPASASAWGEHLYSVVRFGVDEDFLSARAAVPSADDDGPAVGGVQISSACRLAGFCVGWFARDSYISSEMGELMPLV